MTILHKSLGGLSVSEIPKSHGLVPGCWEKIVVVVGQSKIANEVVVSSKWLNGLTEIAADFGVRIEFPDEYGSVSRAADEYLSVLIFLLRVSSDDGGDPVGVSLKMSDFVGSDDALFLHCG